MASIAVSEGQLLPRALLRRARQGRTGLIRSRLAESIRSLRAGRRTRERHLLGPAGTPAPPKLIGRCLIVREGESPRHVRRCSLCPQRRVLWCRGCVGRHRRSPPRPARVVVWYQFALVATVLYLPVAPLLASRAADIRVIAALPLIAGNATTPAIRTGPVRQTTPECLSRLRPVLPPPGDDPDHSRHTPPSLRFQADVARPLRHHCAVLRRCSGRLRGDIRRLGTRPAAPGVNERRDSDASVPLRYWRRAFDRARGGMIPTAQRCLPAVEEHVP